MADNKVKFLRGTSDEYAVAEKDNDTIYFTTDDGKLYIGDKEVSGDGSVTIDNTLSDTSENPVQNKVIKQAIDNKADSSHTHSKADITDFPASLPANGGKADYATDAENANNANNADYAANAGKADYAANAGKADYAINAGNAGNADTVNGLSASDFMPINGDVRKYGIISMNGSDGIRVRHIDGNNTDFDGALYLNYNSPNAPIYMNGANTAIHSGNIGSQSVHYATNAGNANTATTATNAVNANTVGGITDGFYLGLFNNDNNKLGTDIRLYGKYNGKTNDGRIFLTTTRNSENKIHEVSVTYAYDAELLNHRESGRIATKKIDGTYYNPTNKDTNDAYIQWNGSHFVLKTYGGNSTAVDYATNANSATYANIVKTPYLIGTSSNCAYNTILAWANAQTGTAYASIVAGDGIPADAPYQNEAMLKVESDYYGARKIVTWTRYMGGQPRLVMIRPIFGTNWNDDQWRT